MLIDDGPWSVPHLFFDPIKDDKTKRVMAYFPSQCMHDLLLEKVSLPDNCFPRLFV